MAGSGVRVTGKKSQSCCGGPGVHPPISQGDQTRPSVRVLLRVPKQMTEP